MDAPTSIPSEMSPANNNYVPNIDLFASGPTSSATTPSPVDFFATSVPAVQSETKTTDARATDVNSFDPFAAVPLNNFNDSDPFGAFTSYADSSSSDPTPSLVQSGIVNDLNSSKPSEATTAPKKGSFQVKSGIWADSLSRGIIDLNITAPKKVSLAEVGIVGGLSDGLSHEKVPQPNYDMGRAMGAGSGIVQNWSYFIIS